MKKILGLEEPIFYLSISFGVIYGISMRFLFGSGALSELFEIMSISFIFLVPVVIGFLVVFINSKKQDLSFIGWMTQPLIPSFLTILISLLIAIEGLICAIVWIPLFMILSSFGGLIAGLVSKLMDNDKSKTYVFIGVLFLPILISPLEQLLEPSTTISKAKTQILINANAESIWMHIKEVPKISKDELGNSFSYLVGFPKPIEAKLIGEGVGSVREATFNGDVLFIEEVTEWIHHKKISFTITPDPDIPPTTFDQHVVVGGEYFDVLSGTYELEKVTDNQFILHLSSEHRLNTRFNWYTQIWTNFFMNDIQRNILEVVKKRAES